jgi:DNA-binding IclR family transcriptional regulator
LLAKPDGWRVRPQQIADECGLHYTTIYHLLRVLIKAGYIERQIITRRKDNGRFDSGSIYTVHEKKLEDVPF